MKTSNAILRDAAVVSDRVVFLKKTVTESRPTICPERALLWTEYFKDKTNDKKHVYIKLAEALSHVLANKSVAIYPRELIAGNYTSKRVGGLIAPELIGILSLLELKSFPTRRSCPLDISSEDIEKLSGIARYWATRNVAWLAYKNPIKKLRFMLNAYSAKYYVLNELGGIAHIAPDYEKLLGIGTDGIAAEAANRQKDFAEHTDEWAFLESVKIIAKGLAHFGERYADLAETLAARENDPARKEELESLGRSLRNVPKKGASSFKEAVQSLMLAQIALSNESLDVTICPGRMDQYLYPFYKNDIENGTLDREGAKEILSCFTIKLCETVPVFAKRVNRFNSGLPSYQTIVVGGVDRNGNDAVNDLSYIFLELADELRMRQPNFHARIHKNSPPEYIEKIYSILANGSNSPALYNDEVIVPTMMKYGYNIADARDYTPIGCVEPGAQGKSFSSTDAALFNVAGCLELALNEGRKFGSVIRDGVKTAPVSAMKSIEDVKNAFESQLKFKMAEMIEHCRAVEKSNADYHPTPLSSALLDGCIRSGKCSTRGGAVYNFSGIQCVAPTDVGDSFYAIEKMVFQDKAITLDKLVRALKENLPDEPLRLRLRNIPKFGNDDPAADRWTSYVIETYAKTLASFGENTRGGKYVTGLYSVTVHDHFGTVTGALPNGRRQGEPLTSGIAPMNGMDRKGPTAAINSMNSLDFGVCPNGINFNIKFQNSILAGEKGRRNLKSLMTAYFNRGGMQAQVNVFDADVLRKARENPAAFPNLLVRVSGYSAYFSDLTDEIKDEIIERTSNSLQ